MLGIGGLEMVVIMVVVLVVFGPQELPDAMRKAGALMRTVSRIRTDLMRQMNDAVRDIERETGAEELTKSLRETHRHVPGSPIGTRNGAATRETTTKTAGTE